MNLKPSSFQLAAKEQMRRGLSSNLKEQFTLQHTIPWAMCCLAIRVVLHKFKIAFKKCTFSWSSVLIWILKVSNARGGPNRTSAPSTTRPYEQDWRKYRHLLIYSKWVSLHQHQKCCWLPQPRERLHIKPPNPVRCLWTIRCPQISFQRKCSPGTAQSLLPALLEQEQERAWEVIPRKSRGQPPPPQKAIAKKPAICWQKLPMISVFLVLFSHYRLWQLFLHWRHWELNRPDWDDRGSL